MDFRGRIFSMTDKTRKTNPLTVTVLYVLTAAIIQPVRSQCSGTTLVVTASSTYQTFTSPNYPFSYSNDLTCNWRIQAANASDAIRLEVTDLATEYHADCVYDYGEVYDGYNTSSASLGKFCGTSTPSYVTSGNYMTVVFKSDYSLSARGFKAQYKSGERSSLLDPEDDSSNFDAVAILGASIGAVVLIIVVMAIIFTYIQAKKAKEIRRNPHLQRGVSTSRVEPFTYDYGPTDFVGPPPPPPYGDIYSSPASPPPAYSELDPNPQQEFQLPGRPTDSVNGSPSAMGPGLQVNVISDNSRLDRVITNANTRFIRSSNPLSNNQHHQNGNLLRNPVYLPPNQSGVCQTSPNTGNPAMLGSNAGATEAMRLLGTVSQATTRPSDQDSALPNAIGSPTAETANPLLNCAESETAPSVVQANAPLANGTGLSRNTNMSHPSSNITSTRNTARSQPSNTSVLQRNQTTPRSNNATISQRNTNPTRPPITSVPLPNPNTSLPGNTSIRTRNVNTSQPSTTSVHATNSNVSHSARTSLPTTNASISQSTAAVSPPRNPNISRPPNRANVNRNGPTGVGIATADTRNLPQTVSGRNIRRSGNGVAGVNRAPSDVSVLALPDVQSTTGS